MSANKLFRTFLQNVKQTRNMSARGKIYIYFFDFIRKELIINLIHFQQIKGSTKMSMLSVQATNMKSLWIPTS